MPRQGRALRPIAHGSYADPYRKPSTTDNEAQKEAALESLFNSLRKHDDDTKDELQMDSVEKYFTGLGVDIASAVIEPQNAAVFVVSQIAGATTLGRIPRRGFVDGWKALREVVPQENAQRSYVAHCLAVMAKDASVVTEAGEDDVFRKAYRHAFVLGHGEGQKAVDMPTAFLFWDMFFGTGRKRDEDEEYEDEDGATANPPKGIRPWYTSKPMPVDWLALWRRYLREQFYVRAKEGEEGAWKRTVNRDLWNQLLEFSRQTIKDPTLGFWSVESAWPSVIDGFVEWYGSQNIGNWVVRMDVE